MKTYKKFNEDASMVGNSVNGVAGVRPGDEPPGKQKSYVLLKRKFAGTQVFEVSNDVYYKCINGKKKYGRYKKYVGDDDTGNAIREYGIKNPKLSIILKNSATGSMIYLRKK